MDTRLNIYATSGTTIITSGTIDLYDDIPMSLNYNIADIKEPQKRNSDYSKTITVPGTNNNNHLFSNIYEIGIDRLYNPNKKVEARVLYGGSQVFKGWIRLAKIRTLRNNKIEYDFELKGRLDDLFTTLQDLKLTDLTWTDLNHVYSRTNIVNSWSTPVGSNYVYPFIDYGYSINKIDYNVNHFFPAVYIKEAWDRAFSRAGFQYSSTFLTSTFFKSLIMPYTSDMMRLTAAQVNARRFKASRLGSEQSNAFSAGFGIYEYFTAIFNDDNTPTNTDGGNNYNTGTGIYTVPNNGIYTLTANMSFDAQATPTGSQYVTHPVWVVPRIIKNSTTVLSYGTLQQLNPNVNCNATTSSVQTSTQVNNVTVTWEGYLNAGDTILLQVQAQAGSATCTPSPAVVIGGYSIRTKIGSLMFCQPKADISEGDTITFGNTLPQDMKIVEFIVSIMKMFNLYFEYDKNIPNKILIEPRNDYYTSTIQDWSDMLDVSKEPEIIPMGALNAKRYIYKYKKDGDLLNNAYQTTYSETYGERFKDVDNDFIKNHETMEVVFSPTPLYSTGASDRIYPAIVNVDASTQVVHNKTSNPRILYYGGLINCQNWQLTSVTGHFAYLTQYPYCGHLDHPDTPTYDLNFGVPREVYYNPNWYGAYTNNNLYNAYWKQFIDEITDYNSSIVTAWFWLKPADVMEVDFRHSYRFMNQNFRLNKIYDYNPSAASLTKCEFIKIKNGIPFVPHRLVMTGDASSVWNGDPSSRLPKQNNVIGQGGNVVALMGSNQTQIYGIRNFVAASAERVLVIGNDNVVGERSQNISIMNSSGCCVLGGLVNVSIMNSSGVTVTESNTVVEFNTVRTSAPSGAGLTVGTTPIASGTAGAVLFQGAGNVLQEDPAQLFWDNSNNRLGIGTAAPLSPVCISIPAATLDGFTLRDGTIITSAFLYSTVTGENRIGGIASYAFPTFYAGGVEAMRITTDGRIYGTLLHNNAGAVTGTVNQYIASGTYTPTPSDPTNLDATTTATKAQWTRVGNVVTVSGRFTANPTLTATLTSFRLDFPIASNMANTQDCSGVAFCGSIAGMGAEISGHVAGDKALVQWISTDITAVEWAYTYTYEVL